ncbi:MAG: hypothetical protein J6V01_00075 [Clostridia bacterium]|nr:hypothetical protein [Clostridia bacterium]
MVFRKKTHLPPPGDGEKPEKKKSPGELPAVFAAAAQLAGSAALLGLYFATYYLPYALGALCPLCGGLVTLSLVLCRPGTGNRPKRIAAITLPALITLGTLAAGMIFLSRLTSVFRLTWAGAAASAALFVGWLIAEKLTLSAVTGEDARLDAVLRTSASLSAAGRLCAALTAVCSAVKLLGFYDLTKYLSYALIAVFGYSAFFILVSLTVRTVRREIAEEPDLSIPLPFSRKRDFRITGYLEKNTGITMHSLWSMKFIWRLLPYTVLFIALTVWLSTSLTTVDSGYEAAVFRCGRLLGGTLRPGLHVTLPFPFDRVEKYDTSGLNRLRVGYVSSANGDNLWTESHGGEEFQLLLGGGNELVSVNLRIEYRISDLHEYLTASSDPRRLLEAAAYNLITDRVIRSDLETLMAVDRGDFADSLGRELSARISSVPDGSGGTSGIGLTVVSVVLESIHPPMSVASSYQELISANIKAEKLRLEAEAYAATAVAEAETARDSAILSSEAERSSSVAAARAGVAEFMAGVEADSAYGETYRYEKYLAALTAAYGNSRLIILGEGVDRKDIWIGNPSQLTN